MVARVVPSGGSVAYGCAHARSADVPAVLPSTHWTVRVAVLIAAAPVPLRPRVSGHHLVPLLRDCNVGRAGAARVTGPRAGIFDRHAIRPGRATRP